MDSFKIKIKNNLLQSYVFVTCTRKGVAYTGILIFNKVPDNIKDSLQFHYKVNLTNLYLAADEVFNMLIYLTTQGFYVN